MRTSKSSKSLRWLVVPVTCAISAVSASSIVAPHPASAKDPTQSAAAKAKASPKIGTSAAEATTTKSGPRTRQAPTSARSAITIHLTPAFMQVLKEPAADLLIPYGYQFPGPEKYLSWALRDLQTYLQKATGLAVEVEETASKILVRPLAWNIVVGRTGGNPAFLSRHPAGLLALRSTDPEAFIVEWQNEKLYLLGRSDAGIMAAIYTLLDHLGVKWYAPGDKWETIPPVRPPNFSQLALASSGPSYTSRLMFSNYGVNSSVHEPGRREAETARWMMRNRMGGSSYVQNQHNENIIPRELFTTHPEYYALTTTGPFAAQAINGRLPRELARHKPEVVQAAVKQAIRYFEENKGRGSTYRTYSLETGDGVTPDEEGLRKFGNATDLNFWFANEVARGLQEAGHKDKWVGLLSYSDHAEVPGFAVHPRVAVMVTNGLAATKLTTEERLSGLRQRGVQRLGVYDYYNVASWTMNRPGAYAAYDPVSYAATLRRWHGHGARDYQAESTDSWGDAGPGNYLKARVLWNVQTDARRELEAYYRGAFGAAAPEVQALYKDGEKFYSRLWPRYRRDELAYWHSLLTAASARVRNSPLLLSRLNDLKRYYLYLNSWREFDTEMEWTETPTREERYWKLVRFVAANRGSGALHARGLLPTLLYLAAGLKIPLDKEKMGPELVALHNYHNDEAALKALPVYDEAAIERMFEAARLPLDNALANPAVLDPRLRVWPENAAGTRKLDFPRVYVASGIGATAELLIRVLEDAPRLDFTMTADGWNAGSAERLVYLRNPAGETIRTLLLRVDAPLTFSLADAPAGIYTLVTASAGAIQVSVSGAPLQGAIRGLKDYWGFSPLRPLADARKVISMYFLVPAGKSKLHLRLMQGNIDLDLMDGTHIARNLQPVPGNAVRELTFAPVDKPRVGRVTWSGDHAYSIGFVLDEVALYSLSPEAVFYLQP